MKLIFIILTFLASHLQPQDTVFQAINKKNHKIFTIEKNSFVILETKDFEKYYGRLHFLNDSTVLIDTNKILISKIYSIYKIDKKRFKISLIFVLIPIILYFLIFGILWFYDFNINNPNYMFFFSDDFVILYGYFAFYMIGAGISIFLFWQKFYATKYKFRIKIR